ncbi:MAG: DNA repair exonuclease [Planctomycetes bacterium]|nr:DNA repair exonuclease [Planctomycetota bacterium]
MAATLLFVGDLHLGRRPAHLPADDVRRDLRPVDLSPIAAWRQVVDHAIERRVAAVLLAGDVVDQDNARFEAFGPLKDGVARLLAADIGVFAVAGNHDVEALPRLASVLPGFRLIGRGGAFEWVTVTAGGTALAHVLGWSFPEARVTTSPFQRSPVPDPPDTDVPRIGMLHGDLGREDSPHAPLSRAQLSRHDVSAWLLGHIHKPSLDPSARSPLGYLGSVSPLDPTETGVHGPWELTLDAGRASLQQIALAPLRFESIDVALDEVGTSGDVLEPLVTSLSRLHRTVRPTLGKARAVGVRIVLTGKTAAHARIRDELAAVDLARFTSIEDGVLYYVDRVVDQAEPALDLAVLARAADPPGLLARTLLQLEHGGDDCAKLVASARERLRGAVATREYRGLEPADLGDDAIRARLMRSGRVALERLLDQRASSEVTS